MHMFTRAAVLMLSTAILMGLGGCCTTCSTGYTPDDARRMDVAGAIGNARQLSQAVLTSLDNAPQIDEEHKADLRARAQILGAHADALNFGLERHEEAIDKPAGGQGVSLPNLEVRTEALDDEYASVMREWLTWQVRHGYKKPNEVLEYTNTRKLLQADGW
jgi:hypothetical protein